MGTTGALYRALFARDSSQIQMCTGLAECIALTGVRYIAGRALITQRGERLSRIILDKANRIRDAAAFAARAS